MSAEEVTNAKTTQYGCLQVMLAFEVWSNQQPTAAKGDMQILK